MKSHFLAVFLRTDLFRKIIAIARRPKFCLWKMTINNNVTIVGLAPLENYFLTYYSSSYVMNGFFIGRKNNISFSRYLYFCVFDECANFKFSDVIVNITVLHIRSYIFDCFFRILWNLKYGDIGKYFKIVFTLIVKTGN